MTAQEVWEAWEKDPKKRFKKKGGEYQIHLIAIQINPFGITKEKKIVRAFKTLEREAILSLEDFMSTEWEEVEVLKQVSLMEALHQFLINEKPIYKAIYKEGKALPPYKIDPKKGERVAIDPESLDYKWFIKEK